MFREPSFRRGLRDGFTIFLAVGAFGVAFGMLAIEAGIAWWVAVLASALVVSGAAQFAWLGLVGAGVVPVLVTTTGLALRHVPMSARMAALVGRAPLRTRLALAWVLTDETFGLTLSAARRGEEDLVAYKAAVDLQLYSGWLAGTAIGVAIGSRFDPTAWGAEAFFGILFVGLAAGLVRNRWDVAVAGLAVGATFGAAALLPEAWQIAAAAAVAAGAGMVLPGE
ncbi:MAG: AzlC family ABC transporter permease [Acidobacteria bacterium]|nr:AzlC family ABC transporter permease [Acidobacteriota bacterium]